MLFLFLRSVKFFCSKNRNLFSFLFDWWMVFCRIFYLWVLCLQCWEKGVVFSIFRTFPQFAQNWLVLCFMTFSKNRMMTSSFLFLLVSKEIELKVLKFPFWLFSKNRLMTSSISSPMIHWYGYWLERVDLVSHMSN